MFVFRRVLRNLGYKRRKVEYKNKEEKKNKKEVEGEENTRIHYLLRENLTKIEKGFRIISLVLSVFLKFDDIFLLIIVN